MAPICIYCLHCTIFDELILRKIIEIVATRCQILRLKCTKFNFGWGFAPDPAGGAYSAPPDPIAGFKGPTSKGREGRQGKAGEGNAGGRLDGRGARREGARVRKEVKREREVREGRGYAGARKMVSPGARVGSRRA